METKLTTPAVKGVIISLILIVLGLVTVYANLTENKALGFIPIVIFIGGVIWGCVNYSNQMNHNVTFGNVFGHGFKITATVVALMAVYTLLLFLVLKPELRDTALEQARASMEKRGSSESEIDSAIQMTQKMFIPFALLGVILMYGIVGIIASLIGGAVAKKNPNPNPF